MLVHRCRRRSRRDGRRGGLGGRATATMPMPLRGRGAARGLDRRRGAVTRLGARAVMVRLRGPAASVARVLRRRPIAMLAPATVLVLRSRPVTAAATTVAALRRRPAAGAAATMVVLWRRPAAAATVVVLWRRTATPATLVVLWRRPATALRALRRGPATAAVRALRRGPATLAVRPRPVAMLAAPATLVRWRGSLARVPTVLRRPVGPRDRTERAPHEHDADRCDAAASR
jgi:hypothetical protein